MQKYAVIYDANVLYPAPLRDLLLQLATARLFRAQWSHKINDEWIESLLKKEPQRDRTKLENTRDLMTKAVPDCIVTGFEHLIPTINLPDPDDRHVAAAAIHAKSDAIVTFNIKDFPEAVLAPYNLEAIHPDDFINAQIDLDQGTVISAATACCRRLKNPSKTGKEYLGILRKQGLPKTYAALTPFEGVLSLTKEKTRAMIDSADGEKQANVVPLQRSKKS